MNASVMLFHEGRADLKHLLGGKGANLAEMIRIGLPVPPGFTITTQACPDYYAAKKTVLPEIIQGIEDALRQLEETTGKSWEIQKILCSFPSAQVQRYRCQE